MPLFGPLIISPSSVGPCLKHPDGQEAAVNPTAGIEGEVKGAWVSKAISHAVVDSRLVRLPLRPAEASEAGHFL